MIRLRDTGKGLCMLSRLSHGVRYGTGKEGAGHRNYISTQINLCRTENIMEMLISIV